MAGVGGRAPFCLAPGPTGQLEQVTGAAAGTGHGGVHLSSLRLTVRDFVDPVIPPTAVTSRG